MATETTQGDGLADAIGVAEHSGGSTGMPQLDFTHWGNQMFWLALALIAIYLILSRVALPRIAAVLAERQGTITNDIAAAEDLTNKADAAEAAYDQALVDARAEAQRIIAAAKADMQADLDAAIAKADTQIAAKSAESEKAISEIRAGAVESVKAVAKDTVKEIVAAMGGKADAKTVTAAVTARMKG
ncbi:F-type H+-transporting ATPase subunit b [Sulfitobacter undariae]|uniref:ATP synthase subunit b n=1 Tax=Sulfitobacter undariae TaxID=1563671 RepID=A0A7W6E0R7_9RHOB|nr:F0F1 ATP synthase subunit B' [Sulfitobacter undariae]MBB3992618.1 F-type H+-transporting ATPase subunit b [Sulfitobacter undariae]